MTIIETKKSEVEKDFKTYLTEENKPAATTYNTYTPQPELDADGFGKDSYGKWKPFGEQPEANDYSDKATIFFYENSNIHAPYRLKFSSAKSFLSHLEKWGVRTTEAQRTFITKRTNLYAVCDENSSRLIIGCGHDIIEILEQTWSLEK